MADSVFIGNIPQSAQNILMAYLNKFNPSVNIEQLPTRGVKGKVKNFGSKANVVLIVLDRELYDICTGTADEVLSLSKTHLYESDFGLSEFLKDRYNCSIDDLDNISDKNVTPLGYTEPDVQDVQRVSFPTEQSVVKPSTKVSEVVSVINEDTTSVNDSLESLRSQLSDANVRILSLEADLQSERSKASYSEISSKNYRESQQALQQAKDKIASLEADIESKNSTIASLQDELATANETIGDVNSQAEYVRGLEAKNIEYSNVLIELQDMKNKYAELQKRMATLIPNADFSSSPDLETYYELSVARDALRAEVEELRSELEAARARIGTVHADGDSDSSVSSAEVEQLKTSLQEALAREAELNSKLAERDKRVRSLNIDINSYKEQIEDLRGEIDAGDSLLKSTNAELKEAQGVIESLKKDLEVARNVTASPVVTYPEDYADLQRKAARFEEASKHLTEAQETVKQLTANVDKLSEDLATADKRVGTLTSDNEKLQSRVNSLTSEVGAVQESAKQSLTSANAKIAALETDKGILKDKLDSAEDSVKELQSKLDTLEEDSNQAARGYDTECGKLNDRISNLTADIERISAESVANARLVEDYKSKLAIKESDAKGYSDQLTLEKNQTSSLREQLSAAQLEIQALKQSVEDTDALNAKITKLEDSITAKDTVIVGLQAQVSEKDGIISKRDAEIIKQDDNIKALNTTNSQLTEKCAVLDTKLNQVLNDTVSIGSVDILKKQLEESDAMIQKLQQALVDGEGGLTAFKDAAEGRQRAAQSANNRLRKSLDEAREAATVSKDQLKQVKRNVYYRLGASQRATSKLPKLLTFEPNFYSNVYAFMSGSGESIDSLYALFQRQVACNPKKSFLIIDLSPDSAIMKYFDMPQPPSPEKWLLGTDRIQSCVTKCATYKNMRVISTVYSYFNQLYYLSLDWNSIVKDAASHANYVFFYFGCVTDTISTVLFDSLLSIMNGHIIVKGTPQSLRCLTLKLVAMQNVSNVLTSVVSLNLPDGKQGEAALENMRVYYDNVANMCSTSMITEQMTLDI